VVFLAAAAVLVLEILAVRLMAPYVGVSLNTYTGIIGTVLAGISAGAWIGGWAADRVEPQRLLGPILIVGGLLGLATAPLTTVLGEDLRSDSLKAIVALSAATVFLPAFVLSAVTPIVVKMQLQSLNVTGSVVGRMSAFGTAGALVGTFGTGFFLTAHFPTRAILAGVGGILIATGAILWWQLMRRVQPGAAVALAIAAVAAGGAAASVHGPCKVESAYACIRVSSNDAGGRTLMLDNLVHSVVIPGKPEQPTLPYTYVMGAALDTFGKRGTPIATLHIGGGAFTLPRYIAATRPGSTNTVMEIDPAVVDTARQDFGLRSSPGLRIEVGDARLLVGDESPRSYDVVIGDAFSGRSVPWQLTTKEFLAEVQRLLRPRGMYLMNFIDTKLAFVRAEAATVRLMFPHVALFELGTSHVLVGSNVPIPLAQITTLATVPVQAVSGDSLRRQIGDARVLEDDFAPVDQLLR
jgi:spermidine synthase